MSDRRADALERLLLERLERVASHPAAILRRALELAHLEQVPTDLVELDLFCRGPLDQSLSEHLGPEVAEALVEELAVLTGSLPSPDDAAIATSGTRRRPKKRRAASGAREAFVVLASRDEARAEAFASALRGRARIHRATDVFTLMQATESNVERELVLVIDGTVPGLRGPMLMMLARILPRSSEVIFWGAAPPTGSVELAATALPPEATPEEVAARCLSGVPVAEPAPTGEVILLVDDDLEWRAILERRLSEEGYGVIAVDDGFSALEAVIDHRPALVLTAFDIPTLDGQQLAALVVGRFGRLAPPIVMVAEGEVEPVGGVVRVMARSTSFEELLAEVRARLSEAAAAGL